MKKENGKKKEQLKNRVMSVIENIKKNMIQ